MTVNGMTFTFPGKVKAHNDSYGTAIQGDDLLVLVYTKEDIPFKDTSSVIRDSFSQIINAFEYLWRIQGKDLSTVKSYRLESMTTKTITNSSGLEVFEMEGSFEAINGSEHFIVFYYETGKGNINFCISAVEEDGKKERDTIDYLINNLRKQQ